MAIDRQVRLATVYDEVVELDSGDVAGIPYRNSRPAAARTSTGTASPERARRSWALRSSLVIDRSGSVSTASRHVDPVGQPVLVGPSHEIGQQLSAGRPSGVEPDVDVGLCRVGQGQPTGSQPFQEPHRGEHLVPGCARGGGSRSTADLPQASHRCAGPPVLTITAAPTSARPSSKGSSTRSRSVPTAPSCPTSGSRSPDRTTDWPCRDQPLPPTTREPERFAHSHLGWTGRGRIRTTSTQLRGRLLPSDPSGGGSLWSPDGRSRCPSRRGWVGVRRWWKEACASKEPGGADVPTSTSGVDVSSLLPAE